MENRKFRRAARLNRAKALFFTLLFHVAVLGAVMDGASYVKISKILPDVLVEWLGLAEEASTASTDTGELHRP